MSIEDDIRKAQEQQKDIIKSFYGGEATPDLVKRVEGDIEKGGKAAVLGEERIFGGKKYKKTDKGWRPVTKVKVDIAVHYEEGISDEQHKQNQDTLYNEAKQAYIKWTTAKTKAEEKSAESAYTKAVKRWPIANIQALENDVNSKSGSAAPKQEESAQRQLDREYSNDVAAHAHDNDKPAEEGTYDSLSLSELKQELHELSTSEKKFENKSAIQKIEAAISKKEANKKPFKNYDTADGKAPQEHEEGNMPPAGMHFKDMSGAQMMALARKFGIKNPGQYSHTMLREKLIDANVDQQLKKFNEKK